MAGHDSNTMVQVGAEPNVRGDRRQISPGLAVTSINRWADAGLRLARGDRPALPIPARRFLLQDLLPPHGAWRLFERPIRALAGPVARPESASRPLRQTAFVLRRSGGRRRARGPQCRNSRGRRRRGSPADRRVADTGRIAAVRTHARQPRRSRGKTAQPAVARRTHPHLRIMSDTTVSGLFVDNWASALKDNRLYKIRRSQPCWRPAATISRSCLRERPSRHHVRRRRATADAALWRRPGTRAVIATANRFGYDAALDLLDAGIEVAAIVDLRKRTTAATARRQRPTEFASCRRHLVAREGPGHVASPQSIASILDQDRRGPPESIDCDLVLMSAGYTPAHQPRLPHRCESRLRSRHSRCTGPPICLRCERGGLGRCGLVGNACRRSWHAGRPLGRAGGSRPGCRRPHSGRRDGKGYYPSLADHRVRRAAKTSSISTKICAPATSSIPCTTVMTTSSSSSATRPRGFDPVQALHANLNTIRMVARPPAATSKGRHNDVPPPLVAEKFGHLAGRSYEPTRLTAMHDRHLALGARMMPAGLWLRPAYYGPKEER